MGSNQKRNVWIKWRPFIFYGLFVALACLFIILRNQSVSRWPTAEGTVRVYEQDIDAAGSPVGGKAPVTVFVQYQYDVSGETYRSTRLSYLAANDEQASYNPPEYSVGEEIKVYYNPNDPREAFLIPLDPHDSLWVYFIMFFHLFIVLGGVFYILKKSRGG